MSTCADVGSFIESKTSVVQTSNVGFTSEVSDYLVVHTGSGHGPLIEQPVSPTHTLHLSIIPVLVRRTDEVAEWLRRWTANPLGSPRVDLNPILVDFRFCVVVFFVCVCSFVSLVGWCLLLLLL